MNVEVVIGIKCELGFSLIRFIQTRTGVYDGGRF